MQTRPYTTPPQEHQDHQARPFHGFLTRLLHEAFYLEDHKECEKEIPLLEVDQQNEEDDQEIIRYFLGQQAS